MFETECRAFQEVAFGQAEPAGVHRARHQTGVGAAGVILEPGRSVVGRAGVSLYRVGVIKRVRDLAVGTAKLWAEQQA